MPSGVLKIPQFKRLWIGQAVSQFGDALYFLIFIFMIDKLTGNPAMVGYVGVAQTLPYLVFGPYAGTLADRIDRKRVMLASDLSSSLILGGLAVVVALDAHPPIWIIFFAAALLSSVNAFFGPAKSAAIPALVPADRLLEANSLSSATQHFMPILGVAISGTVLGSIYATYPGLFFEIAIIVNGLTFVYSAFAIWGLPSLIPNRKDIHTSNAWKDTKDGLILIYRDHMLKAVMLMQFAISFFVAPFMVVHVAVNSHWFGGKFGSLAAFEFAFGLGMVLMSLVVGKMKIRRIGLSVIFGIVGIGFFIALMAFSKNFWLYTLWNLCCGLVLPFAVLPLNTYIQLRVPDAFRGRVNSAMMVISMGIQPISMAFAGSMMLLVGFVNMFLFMGLGLVVTGLVGLMDRPLRNALMPEQGSSEVQISDEAIIENPTMPLVGK